VLVASEGTAVVGMTIEQLEGRAKGAFFVVQINRRNSDAVTRPPGATRIDAGDGLVVVGRPGARINALFNAPAERPRAGRNTF